MDGVSFLTLDALGSFSKGSIAPLPLLLKDPTSEKVSECVAQFFLGEGESKQAIGLDNGQALLIPRDRDIVQWKQTIEEECSWSQYIQSKGLLGSLCGKVYVSLVDAASFFPAYLSTSFSILATTNHIFVIDRAHLETSTWKGPIVNSLDFDHWQSLLRNLADDCFMLARNNIHLSHDSCNIALVCDTDKQVISIRHFLFDFSQRGCQTPLPKPSLQPIEDIVFEASQLASEFIGLVLEYEQSLCHHPIKKIEQLRQMLIEFVDKELNNHLPDDQEDEELPDCLLALLNKSS